MTIFSRKGRSTL